MNTRKTVNTVLTLYGVSAFSVYACIAILVLGSGLWFGLNHSRLQPVQYAVVLISLCFLYLLAVFANTTWLRLLAYGAVACAHGWLLFILYDNGVHLQHLALRTVWFTILNVIIPIAAIAWILITRRQA